MVSIPHRYAKNFPFPIFGSVGSKFQFLIGTLKTLLFPPLLIYYIGVSIPHRYAKNLCHTFYILTAVLVSIPHRYAKNAGVNIYRCSRNWFQFLIGTLKT